MSKFMKLAIVLVVLGITVVVVRTGMKKADQSVTQITPSGESAPTSGNSVTGDAGGDHEATANRESGHETAKGGENSEDFMGGVTGKSDDAAGGTAQTGSGSGVSVPGTNAPGVSAPGTVGGVVKTDPAKTGNNCFSYEYKHQKEALSKDIEDFLDYSNAFPILHEKVAQKSICVKVNGKPTAFKLSKNKGQQEVVIGSVVGPESLIKVSYCVGTATCREACAVKSNRFMDDLMSDAGDEDEFKESWGEGKEQKKDLQAKVKEFRNVASENKDLQKQSTIRNWDTVQSNEWACKK